MSADSKNSLVHAGDLLAAIRTIYGSDSTILGWDVKQGTETVQGFASLMLRAKVKVKTHLGGETEVNLMVKRQPVSAAHAAMIESMGNIIAREGLFFNSALPLLQERCSVLPIVRTLVSHESVIIMEDLCDAGFETIPKSMQDIGRGNKLTFPIAMLTVRKLAKIHAASLGVNWDEIIPLDLAGAEIFKMFVAQSIQGVIIPIMRKLYPDNPSVDNYIEFMSDPKFLTDFLDYMKYNEKCGLNVLVHGDCHLNNMMFKLDKRGHAQDMRFIDFQIVRYGPACTDLLYFLYTSANKDFRDKHERDIVRAYVESFNAAACVTPDILQFDEFWADYERGRYFGVVLAMGIRPLQFLTELQPPSDQAELPDEFFEGMHQQEDVMEAQAMVAFENDEVFRKEFSDLVSHAMEVFRQYVFPINK